MDDIKISIFISLVLRHKPEVIGISLDEHGWANVDELISGICKTGKHLDIETLEHIVAEDNKSRYSFNSDHTKIRANQGHSISVDVGLKEAQPPNILYHGTASRFMDSIKKDGLVPGSRLYVHLSEDIMTAIKVGQRHGKPVVLQIDSGRMHREDFKFFLSENGVWLVSLVPAEYISHIATSEDELKQLGIKAINE